MTCELSDSNIQYHYSYAAMEAYTYVYILTMYVK